MTIGGFTLTLRPFPAALIAAGLVCGGECSAFLGLPLSFEANRGQTGAPVKFVSHGDISGAGYTAFLI